MRNIDQTWQSISLFFSASSTQKYLHSCYAKQSIPNSELYSFQNCTTFMHYLEFSKMYYEQASHSPIATRPVLLFYGYIQLLKACLLSIDPHYPNSTTLLAHGVTSRKKKKQQYDFLSDEIKTQRNGLFSYAAQKIFNLKQVEGEKISMHDLFYQLPELNEEFFYFKTINSFPLNLVSGNVYEMDNKILDAYHLSSNSFASYLNRTIFSYVKINVVNEYLQLKTDQPLTTNYHSPIRYSILTNSYNIMKKNNSPCSFYGEMLIHYLLLYNLSMISRYETEWWLDLIKTTPNEDYPFIKKFLDITQEKTPYLIKQWLFVERDFLFS